MTNAQIKSISGTISTAQNHEKAQVNMISFRNTFVRLEAKHSGDYDGDGDGDGVHEVYWKTKDGTAYLRALMHDDGNIRYANYQSEAQMTEYLTTQGHESVVEEIV